MVGRVQNFKSWSPEMVPDPDDDLLRAGVFLFRGRTGLWNYSDEQLENSGARKSCSSASRTPEDILDAHVVRQRKAYPVYDDSYAEHLATIRKELEQRFPTLHLVGRNGMHKYNNQDHSMMTAMLCVKNILAGRAGLRSLGGERGRGISRVRQSRRIGLRAAAGATAHRACRDESLSRWMDAEPHGPRVAAVASLRASVLVFLVVSALVFPLVLGLGMTRGLSHDEHQHVAAGALIAREGLLPYRDFPHFHTPYLAFAYALLFRVSDHLLIAARLLSVLCATAILGVIGSIAYHLFRDRGKRFAALVCAGSVLLALTTRLFTETSGHAWNHEPSLFLALLAFAAHLAGLRSPGPRWFVASGALLGLAIGTRITCAPLVAPFGLALLFYPTRSGDGTESSPSRAGCCWGWRASSTFSPSCRSRPCLETSTSPRSTSSTASAPANRGR